MLPRMLAEIHNNTFSSTLHSYCYTYLPKSAAHVPVPGEPRSISDPANRPFMESITKGECPAELDPRSRTQQVSVNLVRSEKAYEAPPKPKYRAFTGTGQTLAGGLRPLVDPAPQQESFVIGVVIDSL